MQDAWRAYLQLALGLTEASKKRAQKVANKLVGTSGATAGQVQAFVEELATTSAANREALTKLIRFEVDRALGAVGLATAEEVADLSARIQELENQLRQARAAGTGRAATAAPEPAEAGPTQAIAVTPAPAAAPPGTAGAAASGSPMASRVVAKKAVPKKAVAKKAVAKKAVAKKSPAGKAVAKKARSLPPAPPSPGRPTPPTGAQP
jgi:polyhydroxyalkanoate synthesis regulator phasin